jgi:hypothetical protein
MFHTSHLVVLAAVLDCVLGHASWMALPGYCDRALDRYANIMYRAVVQTTSVYVTVKRAGVTLLAGAEYVAGETLTVHISSTTGQYLMENSGGSFTAAAAGCAGRRVPNLDGAALTAPTDGSDLQVWGAKANQFGSVFLLETVTFSAPPATPAPTPVPTPAPCNPGTYEANAASSTPDRCVDCPTGSFSSTANAATCTACSDGQFQHEAGKANCVAHASCAAGTHVDTEGTLIADRNCASCGSGTFSDTENAATCTACSDGQFQDQAGQTHCVDDATPMPTPVPTPAPTEAPTEQPTPAPTESPTAAPTETPTASPTPAPTHSPTAAPTAAPCAVNERVSSGACTACEAGETNGGGDSVAGGDTSCAATQCPSNHRVVGNACVACAAGERNAPNDDASGADTACDAIACGSNERVSGHACAACAAGKTRAAGDDASGADTACLPRPTPAPGSSTTGSSGSSAAGASGSFAASGSGSLVAGASGSSATGSSGSSAAGASGSSATAAPVPNLTPTTPTAAPTVAAPTLLEVSSYTTRVKTVASLAGFTPATFDAAAQLAVRKGFAHGFAVHWLYVTIDNVGARRRRRRRLAEEKLPEEEEGSAGASASARRLSTVSVSFDLAVQTTAAQAAAVETQVAAMRTDGAAMATVVSDITAELAAASISASVSVTVAAPVKATVAAPAVARTYAPSMAPTAAPTPAQTVGGAQMDGGGGLFSAAPPGAPQAGWGARVLLSLVWCGAAGVLRGGLYR